MKFLKKRLPALLVALMLAFTPFLLATPAFANRPVDYSEVLTGSFAYSCTWQIDDTFSQLLGVPVGYYDLSLPEEVFAPYDPASFCYWIAVEDTGDSFDFYLLKFRWEDTPTFGPQTLEFSSSDIGCWTTSFRKDELAPGGFSPLWIGMGSLLTNIPTHYLFMLSDHDSLGSLVQGNIFSQYFILVITERPGVLTVSMGFGEWVVSSVSEISSMFWTAEGGLTVLGVLAIASLAISIIILLIYLLAGWLKFK